MSKALAFEEIFSEPKNLRGDLRLLERAIRAGWEIPSSTKRRIREALLAIHRDLGVRPESWTGTDRRVVQRVAKVIVSMHRADVARLRAIAEDGK